MYVYLYLFKEGRKKCIVLVGGGGGGGGGGVKLKEVIPIRPHGGNISRSGA